MTPFEERDAETAKLIRREIERVKQKTKQCAWTTRDTAWHRAFGEIAGMHRILELIDPDANELRPERVMRQ